MTHLDSIDVLYRFIKMVDTIDRSKDGFEIIFNAPEFTSDEIALLRQLCERVKAERAEEGCGG